MLQGSGAVPTLMVEEGPSDFSSDQTDADESSSLAPTTLPRSRLARQISHTRPSLWQCIILNEGEGLVQ